jgi:hypothetical protein
VFLSVALVAEGTSDHDFLQPLLRRAVENLCLDHLTSAVVVSDILPIAVTPLRDESYFEAARRAVTGARHGFHILVVHRDSGGAALSRDTGFLDELTGTVREALPSHGLVPVVPVQEMEAWTLADGDALRAVFRTKMSDDDLRIPRRPAEVERITDPKAHLASVLARTSGPRRRHRDVSSFLDALANLIDLTRLQGVPAYCEWERLMTSAIRDLGYR